MLSKIMLKKFRKKVEEIVSAYLFNILLLFNFLGNLQFLLYKKNLYIVNLTNQICT